MIFKFGRYSREKLNTVHPDLVYVAENALGTGIIDFSIIEGHRKKAEQDRYYTLEKSKVKWPNGKHNTIPSRAVDIVPYVNGKASYKKVHCCVLAGIILACASHAGIVVRWGGNWDMDGEPITDQDFQDLAHFELV